MKKWKHLTTIALTIFSLSLWAQIPVVLDFHRCVNEQPPITEQLHFSVVLPQTHLKDTKKDWHKYTRKKSLGKSGGADGLHLQYGATNENVSSGRFVVHSELQESLGGVQLTVWIMQKNRALISAQAYYSLEPAVREYVREFAIQVYREVVKLELKSEERKQKDLEEEFTRLAKDHELSMKRIRDNYQSKTSAAAAIASNDRDIEFIVHRIDDQKGIWESAASDPHTHKRAWKTLENLEAEKQYLKDENYSQGENIGNLSKQYRKEESEISSTEQKMIRTASDLDKQRKKVRAVKFKLTNIME